MLRKIIFGVVAIFALWVVLDLYWPTHADLRQFDGGDVGRLETATWRSYYDHRSIDLFTELVELVHREYRMPFWRSVAAGYYAAHAAIVFQRGHERPDYELALPDIVSYYGLVRRGSTTDFDPEAVAKVELEWWIVHRQRDRHAPGDLEMALANLQSAIFHEPPDRFITHARARAEAMVLRDNNAEHMTQADWDHIEQLLVTSWTSLNRAL